MRRAMRRRSHGNSINQTDIDMLAEYIRTDKKVVFISGAGISEASGIPTYRGGDDSVWKKCKKQNNTRKACLKNPSKWYNEYWNKEFDSSRDFYPNTAHEAVAELVSLFPNVNVITQNVDSLHWKTRIQWDYAEHLVEAHGRLGLYRCSADETECRFACELQIPDITLKQVNGRESKGPPQEPPTCPACGRVCLPLVLMFDEDYETHSFFQWGKVDRWLSEAEAMVFVGTSFAVTLTQVALDCAKRKARASKPTVTSVPTEGRKHKRRRVTTDAFCAVDESDATPSSGPAVVVESPVAAPAAASAVAAAPPMPMALFNFNVIPNLSSGGSCMSLESSRCDRSRARSGEGAALVVRNVCAPCDVSLPALLASVRRGLTDSTTEGGAGKQE